MSTGGPEGSAEQIPQAEELQAEIAQAREQLAAGVEELTDRLDVKKQAQAKAEQAKKQLRETAGQTRQTVSGHVEEVRRLAAAGAWPQLARRRDVQVVAATGALLLGGAIGLGRRVGS